MSTRWVLRRSLPSWSTISMANGGPSLHTLGWTTSGIQKAIAIIWKQRLYWRGWPSLACMIPYQAQTHTKHIRYLHDLDFPDGNRTHYQRLLSSLSFPQLHGGIFHNSNAPGWSLSLTVASTELAPASNKWWRSHKAGNNVIDYLSHEFYVQIQVYDSLLLPPQLWVNLIKNVIAKSIISNHISGPLSTSRGTSNRGSSYQQSNRGLVEVSKCHAKYTKNDYPFSRANVHAIACLMLLTRMQFSTSLL